jgi:hypothetical protein
MTVVGVCLLTYGASGISINHWRAFRIREREMMTVGAGLLAGGLLVHFSGHKP